jgi:hypothetical protein
MLKMDEETVSGIKRSEKAVGQLLPVLINKRGDVVDGRHRLKANKNWKKVTFDLHEWETPAARLVANTQRRVADEDDYNEFAAFLLNTEGVNETHGKPPKKCTYHVKSGKTIVERIVELTNIPERTVRGNLSEDYKGPHKTAVTAVSLGKTDVVRIPQTIREPVQSIVEQAQKVITANPDKKREAVQVLARTFELGKQQLAQFETVNPEEERRKREEAERVVARTFDAAIKAQNEIAQEEAARKNSPEDTRALLSTAQNLVRDIPELECPHCHHKPVQIIWKCCKKPFN